MSRDIGYVYWVILRAAYGPITRPYGHACLASAEGREGVFCCVYQCILEGVLSWRKLFECVITTHYAHACLAAGEAEAGSLGDEKCITSLDLMGFRELAVEAVKALRV